MPNFLKSCQILLQQLLHFAFEMKGIFTPILYLGIQAHSLQLARLQTWQVADLEILCASL